MPLLTDRFWSKVEASPDGCWLWTSATVHNGYGKFYWQGKHHRAHRLAYEELVGSIPDGAPLDHLCHVRHCVNPEHLRVATHRANSENLTGAHRDSKTGVRGVYWSDRARRFIGEVYSNGRRHYAGSHLTLADAEASVIALRNSLMTNNLVDREAS